MCSVKLQKLRISLKAYESNILDNSCVKIIDAVKSSGIDAIGPIPLPTRTRRYCVLTSPHVNKKARVDIEKGYEAAKTYIRRYDEANEYRIRPDPIDDCKRS